MVDQENITNSPKCVSYMTSWVNSAYTANDAMNLQSALAKNYSSKVRPLETTSVDDYFGMMHITELNIVQQQLHIVGFLLVEWTDSRLTWATSDYGGMNSTFVLLSDIWSPPLVLNNAADDIQIMNDDSDLSSVNAHQGNDGYVIWLAPANFMAQCTINIQYYPFDSQTCYFMVSSWLFLEKHLELGGSAASINMDLYQENGEWDLTGSKVENITSQLLTDTITTKITQKNASLEKVELTLVEKKHLEKAIIQNRARDKQDREETEQFGARNYSFEDLALVFDNFNFILFAIITVTVTVVFMVVLRLGGSS
ncbi:acetylcholine receptor subunit alpha-like 2 [Mercenaria mercenaria]|uniref:acetylcholine receptor subunit alpha-like 2 n=1 Tax=Mercenaria mercenaria TaxID=6596 RepID=UPI00234EF078|nr:acetylcholine receptor subunit alpha-like 2 [Mercenaria mercenaria]